MPSPGLVRVRPCAQWSRLRGLDEAQTRAPDTVLVFEVAVRCPDVGVELGCCVCSRELKGMLSLGYRYSCEPREGW